jgi:hypothetical protein
MNCLNKTAEAAAQKHLPSGTFGIGAGGPDAAVHILYRLIDGEELNAHDVLNCITQVYAVGANWLWRGCLVRQEHENGFPGSGLRRALLSVDNTTLNSELTAF